MKASHRFCAMITVLCCGVSLLCAAEGAGRTRTFLFTYSATAKGLQPGQSARIWLPLPPNTAHQDVQRIRHEFPAEARECTEPRYGNRMVYLEARADAQGTIALSSSYRVTRREVRTNLTRLPADLSSAAEFLKADRKVPLGGKPQALVAGRNLPQDPLERARLLYDIVNSHMRYSKEGVGWGQGDAEWACDSRYGNCSDFHSLFISLARTDGLPARFEMGFPLPAARGKGEIAGYHCWAWFKPTGKAWVPVDISEANKEPQLRDYYFGNLTENRVLLTVGRDLVLSPKQDGPPLNFFIDAYCEVNGEPLPSSRFVKRVTFADVPEAPRP